MAAKRIRTTKARAVKPARIVESTGEIRPRSAATVLRLFYPSLQDLAPRSDGRVSVSDVPKWLRRDGGRLCREGVLKERLGPKLVWGCGARSWSPTESGWVLVRTGLKSDTRRIAAFLAGRDVADVAAGPSAFDAVWLGLAEDAFWRVAGEQWAGDRFFGALAAGLPLGIAGAAADYIMSQWDGRVLNEPMEIMREVEWAAGGPPPAIHSVRATLLKAATRKRIVAIVAKRRTASGHEMVAARRALLGFLPDIERFEEEIASEASVRNAPALDRRRGAQSLVVFDRPQQFRRESSLDEDLAAGRAFVVNGKIC